MRAKLAVDLIESNLQKLSGRLRSVKGIDVRLVAGLRSALVRKNEKAIENAIKDLHVEALFALAAADSRLGRAYALGYELADVCLEPCDRCSFESAFGTQVVPVKDRLADLASSLPAHSSRAVVLSLRAWEVWAAEPELNGKGLSWTRDGAGVEAALRRQGVLWRDLLAGDKEGQDMLNTNHYVRAASSLIAAMVSTAWRFMRPLWLPLGLMTLSLLAGIALLLFTGSGGKALGTILAAAGAIGITGAGIRARLGDVAGELQSQLWGAELDLAIAQAVLIGPVGWDAKVENVPASGAAPKVAANLETLSEFRKRVKTKSARRICDLLAPDAEFVLPGDEPVLGARAVAEWLREEPQSKRIATEPDRVDAVAPGILVSHLKSGAAVWRVREGKVRWREGFGDAEAALQRALSLGPRRLASNARPEVDPG
jgi:hypothetical protein